MAPPDPQAQPDFYKDVPLKRLLAWAVDATVTALACLIILPFTFFTGLFFFPLLFLVVGFLYRMVTLANGSATWGMRLFAIELRRPDGTRLDAGTAFAHTLGYSVSCAIAPLQLISIVMMATTERGQGLTDHVLGTVMVNRRAEAA
ncbi:RDD family protein [Roseobacter sinensis]|uniref:RDD family protein n=1 Tax=Roseobacter sinensis TaxID=2931391 RepID=A0ABT3BC94_9RHOB|nr:RDD family protein [Roseobacter sp. WL0113]MCV3271029.1 RDD family protein [Roseobacter sp. WL0113]